MRKRIRVEAINNRLKSRALELLGLARRAGVLEKGIWPTQSAVKDGRACLVLLAQDASEVQRNKVLKLLSHRDTPRMILGSRVELGAAVGSAPVSALAVTETGFANRLVSQLANSEFTNNETDRRE